MICPMSFKRVLFFMLAGLLLAACGEDLKQPMRVGVSPWPGYEPTFLARNLGYFSDQSIRLSQFQSATEVIRGFHNGVIDVATLTLDEALLLIQDGLDIQIFLVTDISHGGDVIIAGQDIQSVQDLKGRTVGVESSALGAYVLARALDIHGVSFEDITPVHMTVDESEQAFLKGQVDAVVTFEPYRTRILRDGAQEIFSSREMPNEIVDVMVARRAYAEQNPETIKLLTTAWFKAITFMENNPYKAAEIIGQREGLSADEVLHSFKGLKLPNVHVNGDLLVRNTPISLSDGVANLYGVLVGRGLLNKRVSVDGLFTDAYLP